MALGQYDQGDKLVLRSALKRLNTEDPGNTFGAIRGEMGPFLQQIVDEVDALDVPGEPDAPAAPDPDDEPDLLQELKRQGTLLKEIESFRRWYGEVLAVWGDDDAPESISRLSARAKDGEFGVLAGDHTDLVWLWKRNREVRADLRSLIDALSAAE